MSRPPEDRGMDLRGLFFETASEVLQSINDAGLELETRPGNAEAIRELRRAIHTLKGDSAACGLRELSELAHEFEDRLSPEACAALGPKLAELVLLAADTFGSMLTAYQKDEAPGSGEKLRSRIRQLQHVGPPSASVEHAFLSTQFDWTEYELLMISEAVCSGDAVYNVALRIDQASPMQAAAFQLIRNVLHECGTVIALRPEDNADRKPIDVVEAALATTRTLDWLAARCRIPSIVSDVHIERAVVGETADHQMLGEILAEQASVETAAGADHDSASLAKSEGANSAAAILAESTLRVDAARIDAVMNLVGELILSKSMLNRALAELSQKQARDPIRTKFSEAISFQSRVLNELHKCVLKIRMVPAEQLFRRFPRIVRDVAKQCGKDVALEISGQSTELDKSVLDALAEPLMHIVRNAVDHGIEAPEERIAAGKPARGTIRLNAYYQGTHVVIDVRDDGRGIDPERVRDRALTRGLVTSEESQRLSDADAIDLIFEPGFSTAANVTEVSGRGVGMDVVRTVMDRLKGTVRIFGNKGTGARVKLSSPLTLASVQTLLFRLGARSFAIPLAAVVEIARVTSTQIHRVDQRDVLRLRDDIVPVVQFEEMHGIHAVAPSAGRRKNRKFAIVMAAAEKRFCLIVDALIGEEELVIKALPNDIISSDLVSGGSILGDGTVVLILNISALITRLTRSAPLGVVA